MGVELAVIAHDLLCLNALLFKEVVKKHPGARLARWRLTKVTPSLCQILNAFNVLVAFGIIKPLNTFTLAMRLPSPRPDIFITGTL